MFWEACLWWAFLWLKLIFVSDINVARKSDLNKIFAS